MTYHEKNMSDGYSCIVLKQLAGATGAERGIPCPMNPVQIATRVFDIVDAMMAERAKRLAGGAAAPQTMPNQTP